MGSVAFGPQTMRMQIWVRNFFGDIFSFFFIFFPYQTKLSLRKVVSPWLSFRERLFLVHSLRVLPLVVLTLVKGVFDTTSHFAQLLALSPVHCQWPIKIQTLDHQNSVNASKEKFGSGTYVIFLCIVELWVILFLPTSWIIHSKFFCFKKNLS